MNLTSEEKSLSSIRLNILFMLSRESERHYTSLVFIWYGVWYRPAAVTFVKRLEIIESYGTIKIRLNWNMISAMSERIN